MESNKYDISLIRKYLNGELDARSMYQLERQAQEDPLLMDLILGMESGDQKEHDKALLEINELINQRTEPRKTRIIPLLRWGIAASIVIVSVLAALFLPGDKPKVQTVHEIKEKLVIDTVFSHVRAPDKPGVPGKVTQVAVTKKRVEKRKTPGNKMPKVVAEEQKVAMLAEAKLRSPDELNEVVVVGYGTQKKADITGSVATIKAEELAPQQALQGKVAGVVLSKKRSNEPVTVTGIVRDKVGKEPLPGVSVKVKGTNSAVSTDINGRFMITVPESGQILEFAYIGFDSNSVKVNKSDSLVIAMNPSSSALNEVVVVGYGARRNDVESNEEEFKEAQPVKGWQEYNSYLREEAVVDKGQKGLVILTFNVSSTGSVSDFKVIKSSNTELEEKAIDLVKEGPQWRGRKEGAQKVRLRIKFREKEE